MSFLDKSEFDNYAGYDSSTPRTIIKIYKDDPDPQKGNIFESKTLRGFEINEDIFSLSPIFKLYVEDVGKFFNTYNLKVGDRIYISVTPNQEVYGEEDTEVIPIIESCFCIQGVRKYPNIKDEKILYEIFCIYDAQKFFNETVRFPEDFLSNLVIMTTDYNGNYNPTEIMNPKFRSDVVLDKIMENSGLKFISNIVTDDSSHWINSNESRAMFADRILKHAWISDDDAPLLYTDKDGYCYYTSIKKLSEGIAQVKDKNKKNICSMKFKDFYTHADEKGSEKDVSFFFTDLETFNQSGPFLNAGGNNVRTTFYNPSLKLTNILDQNPNVKDYNNRGAIDTAIFNFLHPDDPFSRYKKYEFNDIKPLLGSIEVKQSEMKNNCYKINDGGMVFDELHKNYNIAEEHNNMIKRSFFQNFVKIVVDTNNQPERFNDPLNRPTLGTVVYLDLSGENSERLNSGEYLICKIRHLFQKDFTYTMFIELVADGYQSMGEM